MTISYETDGTTEKGYPFHVMVTEEGIHIQMVNPFTGKDQLFTTVTTTGYLNGNKSRNTFHVHYKSEAGIPMPPIGVSAPTALVKKCEEEYNKLSREKYLKEHPGHAEREKFYESFVIHRLIKKTMPRGGECGVDGYIEAIYKKVETGETVKFVSHDMFDAGVCHLSMRENEVTVGSFVEIENYTELEKECAKWLASFSPFQGIRM